MNMRDTTVDANNRAEMADYYLYHVESPDARWAIAVEQATEARFNVSVMFREPGWDVYGTVRYWSYPERSMAEARYLQLQDLFKDLDEGITLKAMTRSLPEEERTYGEDE